MLSDYYPIKTSQQLEKYLQVYIPLVLNIANNFSINLIDSIFKGDHLGLQVLSKQEFEACDKTLLNYSNKINESVIHDRRNNLYQFKQPLKTSGIILPRVETFEPKPGADLRKIKPGIEHIAFRVENYDDFLSNCINNNVPIDKQKKINNSRFFKTSLVNLVEIEFRNDFLGVQKS